MVEKLKILKYIGIVAVCFVILSVIVVNVTPVPVSLFVRSQFSKNLRTKPENYLEYANKVVVEENLEYPSMFNDNKVDLYLPNDGYDFSVIIWIHGGAFVGGDKVDAKEYATMLSANGYAVVLANYERAPELKYPNQLKQLEEIYSFVLDIAAEYGLDIDNLFWAGTSAGAHMVAQFALIQTSMEYAIKMGFEQVVEPDGIKGLLLYSGPFDVEKINNVKNRVASFLFSQTSWAYFGKRNWESLYGDIATIKNHVTNSFPPTFITDGNNGSFEEHAMELVEVLKKNNVAVSSLFISKEIKTGHEYQFKLDTNPAMESLEETLKFLDEIIDEYGSVDYEG